MPRNSFEPIKEEKQDFQSETKSTYSLDVPNVSNVSNAENPIYPSNESQETKLNPTRMQFKDSSNDLEQERKSVDISMHSQPNPTLNSSSLVAHSIASPPHSSPPNHALIKSQALLGLHPEEKDKSQCTDQISDMNDLQTGMLSNAADSSGVSKDCMDDPRHPQSRRLPPISLHKQQDSLFIVNQHTSLGLSSLNKSDTLNCQNSAQPPQVQMQEVEEKIDNLLQAMNVLSQKIDALTNFVHLKSS